MTSLPKNCMNCENSVPSTYVWYYGPKEEWISDPKAAKKNACTMCEECWDDNAWRIDDGDDTMVSIVWRIELVNGKKVGKLVQ